MKVGRYGSDGTLIETREVADFDGPGLQTALIDPPLACEAGDRIVWALPDVEWPGDGGLTVFPTHGGTFDKVMRTTPEP